jgi:hypothetical protein
MKSTLKLFLTVSLPGFTCISLAIAGELTEQIPVTPVAQEESQGSTRIVMTTSGPAQLTSYWLDNPPSLVVEFQTRNVVSRIGSEVIVNEGAIKRITSEYYSEGQNKTLKSLTFELLERVPYKIWQEENYIVLDIQASLGVPLFNNEGKEVFAKDESKEQIRKRLEAMGVALKQVGIGESPIEATHETPKLTTNEVKKSGAEISPPKRKTVLPLAFWLIGIASISSAGLLGWLFQRRYKLSLDEENLAFQEIARLKTQFQEQNQLLKAEQIIRKTIESASLQREKEFNQIKTELQEEKQLLEQEQGGRKAVEEKLSQKEKEFQDVKGSLESLKEVLAKKGVTQKLSGSGNEDNLWVPGKPLDRRQIPRLDLSKDYSQTIILRIESDGQSHPSTSLGIALKQSQRAKNIKSFANNIGLEGLCFETRHEFRGKEKIKLRLFFFGDRVPMMRIQAKVSWVKMDSPVNLYGISFTRLVEKDKTELSRYIESKFVKS